MCTAVLRLVLISALVGCTPVLSPPGPEDAGTSVMAVGGSDAGSLTDLCADSASAYFARLVRCGELTRALADLYQPVFVEQCPASIPPGVADGRIVFDAAAVQQCLARASAASCLEEPPNCNILRGTVTAGGSCFENAECEEAFSCDTSSTCPGTCIARVAVGQQPSATQECVKSAFLSNGLCTALAMTGQACGNLLCADPNVCSPQNLCAPVPLMRGLNESCAGAPCGQGLQCVNDVCVARVAENGACDVMRRCQDGLRCAGNVCVVVRYGVAGAACADGGDACRTGFFCDGSTCAALRGVGGACADSECSPELFCAMGTCKAPGVLNEACSATLRCGDEFFCAASGVCASRKPAGAQCVESEECLGFCQGLRCTVPPCRDL